MTGYHWFVLIVCMLGWSFDCLDQQPFALARKPAVAELLQLPEIDSRVAEFGGYATSLLLIGWASGRSVFGILCDRIGRARAMVFTVLFYFVFTGLSGLSQTVWNFMRYRFLTESLQRTTFRR